MKAIFYKLLKYLFVLIVFNVVAQAGGEASLDLNVTLNIAQDKVEINQPFTNNITISNLNTGETIDAKNASPEITLTKPSGTTYNSATTGSGWSCTDYSTTVKCSYGNSLTNGQTSNTLYLVLNSSSSVTTLTSDVNVTISNATDPDTSNNEDSDSILTGKSNLNATKTASKTTLAMGETFTYTITVNNPAKTSNTTVHARNIHIVDDIPSNFTFQSFGTNEINCTNSGNNITCDESSLAVDTSKTVVLNVKASSGGTNIKNTATVDADSSDYNTIPTHPNVSVDVELADITLSQSLIGGLTSTSAKVDSNATYRIHVVNNGTSPAENVILSDTLPSGVTYNGFSNSSEWSCSNNSGTINCTLSDTNLTNGESYDLDINVTMPPSHGNIHNDANISTSSAESDTTNNDSSLLIHVKGADLDIAKTPDNGSTDIGTNYTYTIKVDNNGEADAQNVKVTDTLDPHMTYSSDSLSCGSSLANCNLGTITAGSNKSFTVTVTMPTDYNGTVTNTASVSTTTDQENNNHLNDTATTTVKGPNLNITKDANVTTIGLNKSFRYTITVTNVNSAAAKNAKITDTLPSGVKIISILSNPDSWSCSAMPISAGSVFDCNLSNINGNSSSTISFEAQATTAGTKTNTASISQSLNNNDGSASKTITVTGASLNISKNASSTVALGELIDYNITVTNPSETDEENLTITDDLSHLGSGYTVNSVIDSDGWSCSGSTTLTCTKTSFLAGATSTIHFNVNVPPNTTLGNKTNYVSVTTDTAPKPTKTASASTLIKGAKLNVSKTGDTVGIANESVTFYIKVKNYGSATAKDTNTTIDLNTNSVADFTNVQSDCGTGTFSSKTEPFTCSLGDISSGATKTITIKATAPNYDSAYSGSFINNSATASTSTIEESGAVETTSWSIPINGADLVVNKTPNTANVAIGQTVTYTISLENQGDANATNISLDDVVHASDATPLKLSNLQAGAGWSCTTSFPSSFHCDYSSALSKDTNTTNITIDATAPSNATIGSSLSNDVNVSNDTAEKEYTHTNKKSSPVTVRGADLSISKTVSPNPAKLKENVTYTITVKNNDLADANNTDVNDTLLSGFTNIHTSGCDNDGSSVSGQSVHCTLGNIASGVTKTFTITTDAPDTDGTYPNTATTGSDTPESNIANNTSSVNLTVKGADLIPHKSAPSKVAGNSTFTYTISLRNIGNSTAYGAVIDDTIPDNNGTTYVASSLSVLDGNWTCTLSGQNLHCNTIDSNLSIPSGYSKNIASFQVKAGPAHYWIHNTVTTDTNTSESYTTNNSYTKATEVINVDLQAIKSINNHYGSYENYVGIDGNLTYKIYVRNRPYFGGYVDITDANVTDILPINITNISVSPGSKFDCNITGSATPGSTLFCKMKNGDILHPNWTWTLAATITANAIDATHFDINNENNNFIINKYKAETSLSDSHLYNNAPTSGDGYLHTNTLVRGANMSITKTTPNPIVGAEHQFHYYLHVKNMSRTYSLAHDRPSTTATNIVVKDKLPDDINFTSATGVDWNCSENSHIVTCKYNNNLDPNAFAHIIGITVAAPNTNGQTYTNEANVTNDTPELVRLLPDNTDDANITTEGTDISVSKTGPANAGMGEQITYNITVTNNSTKADAQNIYVIDTLPSGATYDGNISNSHWTSSTEANGSIRFTYDKNLTLGTSNSFTFSSTLPLHTGIVTNHAEAFTSTVETSSPNTADFNTNIKGADLVFKNNPTQNPNPVGAYGHHNYNIIIHNQGFSTASDINVTVNFDDAGSNPGWNDVNGSGSGWNCDLYDSTNKQLTCHLPSLAGNSDSSTLIISSTAPNYNGLITNSATVAGKDDTNTTTGETISIATNIIGSDLKILKQAKDPDPNSDGLYHDNNITVGIEKPVDFKFITRNNNLGLAKDINITDTFPAGFSDLNITDQGDWNCSLSGLTLTCSRLELAPNTSATDILISAKAPSSIQTATNTATIDTTTEETDNTNNTNNVKIKTEGATLSADLNVSKTEVAMNEIFTYSLTLTNSGKNDGIDINATDILPTDFTFLDNNGSDSNWTCSQVSNTIICNQPSISDYNGSSTLKLNIKAPSNNKGIYANQIKINSGSIENNITANAPDVRVIGADLNVSIDANPTIVIEDRNVTFNINVKDINISTANNVVLKQIFSQTVDGIYIISGTNDCNITDSNQSVTCIYSHLDFNQDKNITIIATMPDTNVMIDPLTSTVSATTSTTQEDLIDHNESVNIRVIPIKPVADYRFEECKWDGTAGEVVDSINGLNGTATTGAQTENQILAQDDNNFSTKWRVGKFDGNGSITVPSNSKLQITGDQTISMWIKPTDFGSGSEDQIILSKSYDGEGAIYQLAGTGKLAYFYGISSDNYSSIFAGQAPVLNKWNHICVVRDFTNMKLRWYINGTMVRETNVNPTYNHARTTSKDLTIAKRNSTDHANFKGDIDEVEIYDMALDNKAVKDIYNFEKNGKDYNGTNKPETTCDVDLQVVKTVLPSGNVGAESGLDYTIKVTNISNEPVTKGFALTDVLPADVNYTSVGPSSNMNCNTSNDDNFTCTYPNTLIMKKNDFETITAHAITANVDKVNIVNTATVVPVQLDTNTSNNSDTATNYVIGTDLKITKIATPRDPNHPKEVYYDLKVENISNYADARGVTVTDHYDNRLIFVSSTPSCSDDITHHTFTCLLNNLAKHATKNVYVVMKVNHTEQNLTNEANVTSLTVDTDLSNNHDSVTVDVDSNGTGIDIIEPHYLDFRLDGSANKYGNIATIGNTILVAQDYNNSQKLDEVNSTYAMSKGSLYANSSSAILSLIDTNSTNSDDNITIEYASLLWGGHIHGDDENVSGYGIPFNSVKFITPDGVVHTITADKNSTNGANRTGYYHFKRGRDSNSTTIKGNYRIFYGARADITDIIKDLNISTLNGGEFTVADMIVTKGIDNSDWAPYTEIDSNGTISTGWNAFRDYGYFGGWTMVVAYSVNHRYHREVKFKNLSSFSGFKVLVPKGQGDKPRLDINVNGFITPIHGNIESSLFDFIQGGDKEIALESMTIDDKSGIPHLAREAVSNTNNIFNDTITVKNVLNNNISKNPNETYNVGNDIDQYNLNSYHNDDGTCAISPCYLSNKQDKTTVKITVEEANTTDSHGVYQSEQAFTQMLSMQTQIFTPDFIDSYKECFKLKSQISPQLGWVPCSDPTPLLRKGDIIKYRITAINTGDDYAKDIYILDNLPKEATYEQNSSVVTYLLPFDDLETNSPCSNDDYDSNETVRTQCFTHLKALIENNTTSPLSTVDASNTGHTSVIDNTCQNDNCSHITYSDVNNSLVYHFDTFPRNNLVWIEFNTTINGYAALGKTFKNKMSITFTNPTLADYNLSGGTVTQVSLPVESSPVYFNWDNIDIAVKDVGRNSVGAKVVNAPFNLNLTLSGVSTLDQTDANTSIYLNSLRIIDVYNGTYSDIYPTVINSSTGIALNAGSYTWTTSNTSYSAASKELGFDMNITIKSSDGNYSESKIYPHDFNASMPYAGDVFTTRPKDFSITLSGPNTTTSGAYTMVKSAKHFSVNIIAPDIGGTNNSPNYNASLSKGNGISIGLDPAFSTNNACISQGDLNISNLNFTNGIATTNSLNYKNVGIVKLVLKDNTWTAKDNPNDCNTIIGDNNSNDSDGLISCSVDGNSTSIVFEPDHFTYTDTNITDFNGGGFTYMVSNPISNSMFAKITTTLEAKNSNNNTTSFFSNTCFAYNTDVHLIFNTQSKDLNDLNLSIANENNLTNIESNSSLSAIGNSMVTKAYANQFANGISSLTFRLAMERNSTTPLQPALIDPQNLKGSITGYFGIANANVAQGTGTNINGTGKLHYLFGRVHSPDYRFAGNSGTVKIYYEAYCKDCSQTYRSSMNILGTDSMDSVNWYINTLHTNLNDGNVTNYTPVKNTTLSAYSSTGINNGIETLIATAPSLPYIDKIDINATDWVTFDPKDFILEFQNDQEDWAGQGKLGHTIDTNVSKRSNRRLNW